MKEPVPLLLPLLRTRTQGEIMAWIWLGPGEEHSLAEIAAAVGTSAPTVKREVDRLQDAGLVASRVRGNTRLVRVLTDNPVYRPLSELLALTFGPPSVLRESLAAVKGIDSAVIYGSWAARHAGQPGAVPGDVDVLVVGSPERFALREAIEAAEARLHREVNVRVIDPDVWARPAVGPDQAFRATLGSRPTVNLIGDLDVEPCVEELT